MNKSNNTLNHRVLKYKLYYNEWTGVFTRKSNGNRAGIKHKKESGKTYLKVYLDGVKYYAHRLAWFYVHEEFPDGELDHIDGDGTNNRIRNLRIATREENQRNTRLRDGNNTGLVGVNLVKNNKWVVTIRGGGSNYRGTFDDLFEACCIRKSLEVKYNYHKNHGTIRPL